MPSRGEVPPQHRGMLDAGTLQRLLAVLRPHACLSAAGTGQLLAADLRAAAALCEKLSSGANGAATHAQAAAAGTTAVCDTKTSSPDAQISAQIGPRVAVSNGDASLQPSEAQLSSSPSGPPAKRAKQQGFDFARYQTRYVALRLLYLGWAYHGFPSQV